eukprot:8128950-Pyramimonas_sp.AAC.1
MAFAHHPEEVPVPEEGIPPTQPVETQGDPYLKGPDTVTSPSHRGFGAVPLIDLSGATQQSQENRVRQRSGERP